MFIKFKEMDPFPYKEEFIDPEVSWDNAVQLDVSPYSVIPDHTHWRSLPRRFRWEFTDPTSGQRRNWAIVPTNEAYEQVDRLVDWFSDPVRMDAHKQGKLSPKQYYYSHHSEVVNKAVKMMESSPIERPLRYYLREAVYESGLECTSFKISVSKTVYTILKSQKVLDGSAGWGDRMLGAAAARVPLYHGVDPNTNMTAVYEKIIKFVQSRPNGDEWNGANYAVVTADFLKSQPQAESYDTFFTSPPYGPYEVYQDHPDQSIHNRDTPELWIRDFLYPYLRNAWSALINGGYLALYITDVGKYYYVEKMWEYVTRQLGGKFLGIIAVTNTNISNGYPIWVWRK